MVLRTQSYPARHELNGVPIGVAGDLVGYTGLGRDFVERERERRREISFRTEWHASPGHLRADHWYYLSSKGYLFANASHVVNSGFVDRFVRPYLRQGGRVLDYGGAAGNLALMLTASGYEVSYADLGASQRDFVRCRIAGHGLRNRINLLDWWNPVEPHGFDAYSEQACLRLVEESEDRTRVSHGGDATI